jgi:anti-sigma factor RsiW
LPELLYGELETEEKSLLEKHLAECSACQREYRSLSGVRELLDQVPAHQGKIDLSQLYLEAAQRQDRRARRWRRLAVCVFGAAALFAFLALGLRLEARLEPHQVILRWGAPPPLEAASTPPRQGGDEPVPTSEGRSVAALEERLQLHGKLIHALADDIEALERQERQDASQLQVRLRALQEQNAQRWLAINRTLDAIYTLSQKGE